MLEIIDSKKYGSQRKRGLPHNLSHLSFVPVIAYAELMGMTMVPTVRSAMARLIRNMFET